MKTAILASRPGWLYQLRLLNVPPAAPRPLSPPEACHGDRWGIVAAALVLGLTVGIVGATLVWSATVDKIVAHEVARAQARR
ncbi:MAG: hypothetical protein AB1578_23190 [Thermodesulfobacteriota bacterium]